MKNDFKKMLKNVSFLFLLLQLCIVFGQNLTSQKRIVIDVGHGGKDTGAIGTNGIKEKEVVLNIAKEIVRLNKTVLENRFDIYLTRYIDRFIPLSDRSRLAISLKTDLFVSLHCNASKNISKGIEVYVHNSELIQVKESIMLGLSVLNESTQKLQLKKRGIKFANFQVLRETVVFCPAVLIETGFVTNADEADYFLEASNLKAMALAIILGINNYLNTEL